jgi:origin recognition complex subunit 3
MHGQQFDVEQSSATLERVFQKVVAGCKGSLRLGPALLGLLIERQHDHVQSAQAFVGALKYGYMCHFYANPLSCFLMDSQHLDKIRDCLQAEHFEAIRNLPSFRNKIEDLLEQKITDHSRKLIEDDEVLFEEVKSTLINTQEELLESLRSMHLLATALPGAGNHIEIYLQAYSGKLDGSDIVRNALDPLRTMSAGDVITLIDRLVQAIKDGDPERDLEGWAKDGANVIEILTSFKSEVQALQETCDGALRTSYAAQNQTLRTTVIGQKVHLSKEKAELSDSDAAYTKLIEGITLCLSKCFHFPDPQGMFLQEIWLYDLKSPYRDVFTPKPRFAIERALSAPHDYLGCTCCRLNEGLSSSQPPTAILCQLYLETGLLINVFDLWSAFYTIVGGEDGEECDERSALALFYKALADLKMLGMIKNSRKKTDHLAKLSWKGL